NGTRTLGDKETTVGPAGGEYDRSIEEWKAAGFDPGTKEGTTIPREQWLAHGYDKSSTFGVMPQFVDAEKGDFRPAAGSVGIDMGAVLSAAVPVGIDGTARPQGKAVDCRCYENK